MKTLRCLRFSLVVALVAGLFAALATSAYAEKGTISLELNKLESRENACRIYMVFKNALQSPLTSFKPEFVFFAKNGVIASRLVVEAGPLPVGKTKVKLFDAPGTKCGTLRRLLLNSIAACMSEHKPVPDCTARAKTSSLSDVGFIK